MRKVNDNNKLAIQMLIAMVSGILVGLLFMAARQSFGADSETWRMINNLLFQDITARVPKAPLVCFISAASCLSGHCS